MATEIFISYRRSDAGWAGRIYDRLENEFKREDLFMDIESIAPGHVFDTVIRKQAESAKIMLAIIGQNWLSDEERRRLGSPDDYVRRELEIGLQKKKKGVIPILIEPVPYLVADELPETMRDLAKLQALRITHKGFRADVQEVVSAIKGKLDEIAGGGKRAWDRSSFLDEAQTARGDPLVKRLAKIIDWAGKKYHLKWGNGARYGTAQIIPRGGSSTAFSVDHTGTFYIFMLSLQKMGAFSTLEERQKFIDHVNTIQGLAIAKERTGRDFIGFQISNVDLDDMDQLLRILDAGVERLAPSS